MEMNETLVIAIGGNAILKEGQKGTPQEQFENVMACCGPIVELYEQGYWCGWWRTGSGWGRLWTLSRGMTSSS